MKLVFCEQFSVIAILALKYNMCRRKQDILMHSWDRGFPDSELWSLVQSLFPESRKVSTVQKSSKEKYRCKWELNDNEDSVDSKER